MKREGTVLARTSCMAATVTFSRDVLAIDAASSTQQIAEAIRDQVRGTLRRKGVAARARRTVFPAGGLVP